MLELCSLNQPGLKRFVICLLWVDFLNKSYKRMSSAIIRLVGPIQQTKVQRKRFACIYSDNTVRISYGGEAFKASLFILTECGECEGDSI